MPGDCKYLCSAPHNLECGSFAPAFAFSLAVSICYLVCPFSLWGARSTLPTYCRSGRTEKREQVRALQEKASRRNRDAQDLLRWFLSYALTGTGIGAVSAAPPLTSPTLNRTSRRIQMSSPTFAIA